MAMWCTNHHKATCCGVQAQELACIVHAFNMVSSARSAQTKIVRLHYICMRAHHLVSEDAIEVVVVQGHHPLQAHHLVFPQRRARRRHQRFWRLLDDLTHAVRQAARRRDVGSALKSAFCGGTSALGASWMTSPTLCGRLHVLRPAHGVSIWVCMGWHVVAAPAFRAS